ncbi:hypothetical protein B0T17DRAFT_521022 [Bombardia bombarda]|uniref:RRM domain-containing protein n=1 Tax=Bombardia bombarda TaxID=252184 RepID=A0AA39XND3_9PEZI|nr:hypothetical protein B0T17DRAFT_521022 [Bombardia bombarda]
MLFPEEHSAHLKKWIVKRLENTSDADADVLADYVLALLRHDGDMKDVRSLCETEIPDFLKGDSSVFVNDVFDAIARKSYLPGGAPAPPPLAKPQQQQYQQQQQQQVPEQPGFMGAPLSFPPQLLPGGGLSYDDVPSQPTQVPQQPYQNGAASRKRPYSDAADAQKGRDLRFGGGAGGRAFKQPRRGGLLRVMARQLNVLFPPALPGAAALFDPRNPKAMNIMLGLLPTAASTPHAQPRRRARSGAESMFVTPVSPAFRAAQTGGQPQAAAAAAVEEYDPTNALMSGMWNLPPHILQAQQQGGRREHGSQKKRGKAPFSADGPVHDRTKSTIVVENIPEENFSEDQVKEFFSQFGNVVEVSMQPYKRLAIVKFDNWFAAQAAWKSPKVVFDNRFVKVFWYKDEDGSSTLPASMPLGGGGGGRIKQSGSVASMSDANAAAAAAGHPTPPAEIDMEEFLRKQEEAQKIHEEKARKLQEVEKQRQELEKRQQELYAKQQAEKAKLEARLAKKSSNGAIQTSNGEGGDDDGAKLSSKPMSQSEALRAQLAALEAEAKQLGIDPDDMGESSSAWGSSYRGRGGYVPRGRGGYAPRGSRGAFRGRGNNHAAYAAYSLDNRPKKVTLTGVDFTVPEKDETLRQYLFGIGEFTDIQTSPEATDVTFKDRKTAENFFNDLVLNNKEIAGIDGHVEPTWSGGDSKPDTPTGNANIGNLTTIYTAGGFARGGGGAAAGAAKIGDATNNNTMGSTGSISDDKDVSIVLEHANPPPPDNNEMDYDVADDNQWY